MLYELVLQATYANQVCINRWNYVSLEDSVSHLGAFALLDALGFFQEGDPLTFPTDKMFYKTFNILAGATQFVEVLAKAVYDPLDFYDQPFNPVVIGGDQASNGLSPTVAYGFSTNRVRQDIARGTKRFVGVSAGHQSGSGVIDGTQMGRLQTLASAMAEEATGNDGTTDIHFKPTIVQKLKYETPSGKFAYKYYSTLELQSAHWYQNFLWTPYPDTRTQTSRQYGRGV